MLWRGQTEEEGEGRREGWKSGNSSQMICTCTNVYDNIRMHSPHILYHIMTMHVQACKSHWTIILCVEYGHTQAVEKIHSTDAHVQGIVIVNPDVLR